MVNRIGLGRGLSSLLGDDYEESSFNTSTETSGEGIKQIPVEDLCPSPFQPRRVFDESAIEDLVESIKKKGVIQPLIVRQRGDKYEIIGGERRWRASKLAGLEKIPAIVHDFTDKEAMEVALIENLQRQDLNALEEAEGYRRLMEEFKNTQEELAAAVGKSRSHIANMMRLLGLPDPVKKMLEDGKITAGHARALLTAKNPEKLAEQVVREGLNVRQIEKLAQENLPTEKKKQKTKKTNDKKTECDELAKQLSHILQLEVQLKPKAHGGEVVIAYSSLEELDKIISRLSNTSPKSNQSASVFEEATSSIEFADNVLDISEDEDKEVVFDEGFDSKIDIK